MENGGQGQKGGGEGGEWEREGVKVAALTEIDPGLVDRRTGCI